MSHHGDNPLSPEISSMFESAECRRFRDQMASFQRELSKGVAEHKLGATGEFPEGKLNADDEGGIRLGIARSGEKVVINFGKPVAWVGFNRDQAREIGETLIRLAGGQAAEG